MTAIESILANRMRRAAAGAGALSALIGSIVLVGWTWDIPSLKSVLPGLVEMKINTALGLLLCGISLSIKSLARRENRWQHYADLLAVAGGLCGLLTLIEYLSGFNLHIDELFVHDLKTPLSNFPGRMAPMTAVCLPLIGAGLLLLDTSPRVSQILSLLMLMVATLAVLGYAFGVQSLYKIAMYSSVALHTAVALIALSVGALMSRRHSGISKLFSTDSVGGQLLRRMLPVTLIIPLILGWVRLQGQLAGYYGTEFGLAMFTLSIIIVLAGFVWWNAVILDKSDMQRQRVQVDRDDLLVRERAARERAEKAVHARDQLLSVVSHELRTPLTPVMLITSSLEGDSRLPEEVRDDLHIIHEQIDIEARLIDDLLDLVSLDQGKLELTKKRFDLHDVIRNTAALFSRPFEMKGVDLTLYLSARSSKIFGDAGRIQQVLWNLLSNALKFTHRGGSVRLYSFDSSDGQLCLEMTDNGAGIEPAVMSRMFGAFEQADPSTTRRFGGLGIGLAICRQLVMLHGGTIDAKSEGPGKGATFRVHLPVCADQSSDSPISEPETLITTKRLKVLVVEDNPQSLRVLERVLTSLGHEVECVACAQEAMHVAAKRSFDLLISDIGLPDISGWELMRELRKQSEIPGIAISGFVAADDKRKSLECGYRFHLRKPLEISRLIQAIESASDDNKSAEVE